LKAIAVCQMILQLDPNHVAVQSTLADLYARRDAPGPGPALRMPPAMSDAIRHTSPPPAEGHLVDVDKLAKIPLFSDLDRGAFLSILKDIKLRAARAGTAIVTEGEDGASMYVIVEGSVRVTRRPPGAEPKLLGDMGAGEFFGEIALLAKSPRIASVTALTDTELLELGREQLDLLARRHPRVGEVVGRFCKERLLGNMLRAAPLFKLLPSERLGAVIDLFQVRTCTAGSALLEMGQPGKGLFVILRGECEVFHTQADGKLVPYPPLHEGDVFGELSLLQGGTATATVRATSTCVLLFLQREWFDELLLQSPAVRDRIYALASERAQRTREIYARGQIDHCLV